MSSETSKTVVASKKVRGVTIYLDEARKEALEKAVEKNLPVLLVGDTGAGKTAMVRELAQRKGIELFRLNLTGQTGVDEFLGKWLASPEAGTYWLDGLLVRAMKEGKWIVLDEINMALPEILSALHSLLDDDRKVVIKEKDGETIHPHEDFRLFATMNPEDEYAGTKELNKAFLSRFPVVMNIEYSEKEDLIIQEQAGVDAKVASALVILGREIRKIKEKALISFTCSTRDLIYCATLMAIGLDKSLCFQLSILNKAPADEREEIRKVIELITGDKIKTSKKVFKSLDEMIKEYETAEEKMSELKNEMSRLKDIVNKQDKEHDNLLKELKKVEDESHRLKVSARKLVAALTDVAKGHALTDVSKRKTVGKIIKTELSGKI